MAADRSYKWGWHPDRPFDGVSRLRAGDDVDAPDTSLSTRQFAEAVGLADAASVRTLIEAGRLPGWRRGRAWRIDADLVEPVRSVIESWRIHLRDVQEVPAAAAAAAMMNVRWSKKGLDRLLQRGPALTIGRRLPSEERTCQPVGSEPRLPAAQLEKRIPGGWRYRQGRGQRHVVGDLVTIAAGRDAWMRARVTAVGDHWIEVAAERSPPLPADVAAWLRPEG